MNGVIYLVPNVGVLLYTTKYTRVNQFLEKPCELRALFARLAEQRCRKVRDDMATHEITAEMNLKSIIAESRKFAQALNEFADDLERIENKYGTETEDEEYEMVNLGNGLFEKRYKAESEEK